jgi:hypothetical protein
VAGAGSALQIRNANTNLQVDFWVSELNKPQCLSKTGLEVSSTESFLWVKTPSALVFTSCGNSYHNQ